MDTIDEVLETSDKYLKHFISRLKVSTQPKEISCSETAEILLGRCDLSERGFKSLRVILMKNNVILPPYDKVRHYCDDLIVGEIKNIHVNSPTDCPCMGVTSNVHETLQLIVSNEVLFRLFHFPTENEQEKMFDILKKKDGTLYSNLDKLKRTIFIRVTGDNFRASARMPTEQTSFSVLNIRELVNCPYGQFITTLWRGSESRQMIETHVLFYFDEVSQLVRNGTSLIVNNKLEEFNVICLFVADLCFIKDVIGQCQCTALYGCYHCMLKSTDWLKIDRKTEQPKTIDYITKNGQKALHVLGKNPTRDSAKFTNFQQSHGGQWVNIFCYLKI